jgi:leader peptidase (prepilin peptidase)/N-methyltransferase
MQHAIYILFFFALGACVGSFLNVVVWRLPRGESLVTPPSHCPKCNTPLRWYDNLPVIGWIKLGGKCRYCRAPISPRYPIVEAITGGIFVFYYVMFFILNIGPCATTRTGLTFIPNLALGPHWPIYILYMFLVSALLAASLIDAELFIIPTEICWTMAIIGMFAHAIISSPGFPGALNVNPQAAALAAGGGVGLLISIALWWLGKMPTSFPHGEPLLEVDRTELIKEIEQAKREGKEHPQAHLVPPSYTKSGIRKEIRKEMLFLMPPMLLAIAWWALSTHFAPVRSIWLIAARYDWVSGLLGSVLGALVGAFVVWITRILGTLGFGRVAMGLGDVHLMFGVGAIIGAGAATVVFFIAPFFGLVLAIWMLVTGTKRELPYGPYLSLATAFCLLFYCDIAAYLAPGMAGLMALLRGEVAL